MCAGSTKIAAPTVMLKMAAASPRTPMTRRSAGSSVGGVGGHPPRYRKAGPSRRPPSARGTQDDIVAFALEELEEEEGGANRSKSAPPTAASAAGISSSARCVATVMAIAAITVACARFAHPPYRITLRYAGGFRDASTRNTPSVIITDSSIGVAIDRGRRIMAPTNEKAEVPNCTTPNTTRMILSVRSRVAGVTCLPPSDHLRGRHELTDVPRRMLGRVHQQADRVRGEPGAPDQPHRQQLRFFRRRQLRVRPADAAR